MIIGLDVGGTHADIVLLGPDGVRAHAKVDTDPDDLGATLLEALDRVLHATEPAAVRRVVLSTTLTTNAVVGAGLSPVGMLVCAGPGVDPALYRTGEHYAVVSGAIDHRGREISPLDPAQIDACAERFAAAGIRYVGVVGKFSTRNPAHELGIAERIAERFERVFTGHRVSGQLNFPRRIATTHLAASVYPLHRNFYEAIAEALRTRGVSAPVHLLKADGGTLSLAASLDSPAETVLSGPAASVMGAIPVASPEEDVVVLDIGGTTTEIALLSGGSPLLEPLGITIGATRTLIRALLSRSIGVGGDSEVRCVEGKITIGPRRLGAPLARGGPALTPTDALIALGESERGDPQVAAAGVAEFAAELGCEPAMAARAVIDHACRRIMAAVDGLVDQVNGSHVDTIHELLDGHRIRPARILVLGGPAESLAPHLARRSQLPVELVPDSGVANAIGAAMARPTDALSLIADTEQGWVSCSGSDRQWRCDRSYRREQALEQARALLFERLGPEAGTPELEVVEDLEFNIVRGFSTVGRNIRLTLQVKPGLLEPFTPEHAKVAVC
ncbi:hydantoinase/oxoprolinase family protein [Marichromatium gracile]|uniref:hydantoinase/oxoprolinase family protein n=1 Tax=Marichromatium gracile TaxID=1048 RepID=UPI001F45F571|nr:hydantoinase/oxoprolinase family protein [Marichromatium gracile]MCF1182419.1 hydantoinase/oxoprolinase family protein [Marichromatium gracile]